MRLVTLALALALASGALAQPALDRASQNYLALQNGSKQLANLSPAEIAEVQELDRRLRARHVTMRDCDRQRAAAVSDLDRAVLSLKCPPEAD